MLVILPFEKAFYQKWNFPVTYVGHPLVEVVDNFLASFNKNENKAVIPEHCIALLPGSRQQEVLKKLPVMLAVSQQMPDRHFVVAKAPGLDDAFYQQLLAPYPNVSAVRNQTYALLAVADAALVTSGTATLETALFGVPEIICYKGSAISYEIAKKLIKIKFIGLVNLIMDREVVKELIQHELTVNNLLQELGALLNNPDRKAKLNQDYQELKALLGKGGNASANAAACINEFLEKKISAATSAQR
jgi:lipid-A-disaccharide synthase